MYTTDSTMNTVYFNEIHCQYKKKRPQCWQNTKSECNKLLQNKEKVKRHKDKNTNSESKQANINIIYLWITSMPKIWVEDQNKIQKQEKSQIQNISMDYKISKCLGGHWVTPPNAKSKLKKYTKYLYGLQNSKIFRGTVDNPSNAKSKWITKFVQQQIAQRHQELYYSLRPKIQVILEILG